MRMLIEMSKKTFFNLYLNDLAAFKPIKLFPLKTYLLCTLLRSRLVQTRHYYLL